MTRLIRNLRKVKPTVVVAVVTVLVMFGVVVKLSSRASTLTGDLNNDGTVNILDLSILLNGWGKTGVPGDLNGDGAINVLDLSLLLTNWTKTGPTPTPTPTPTTTPTPIPTPTPTSSGTAPSGVAMPVGNIAGWTQIFTDDFTTNVPLGGFKSVYGTKWSDYGDPSLDSAGKIGVNSRYSTSKTVSVQNYVLDVNTHYDSVDKIFYADALLPMRNGARVGQLYGRYVTRFRVVNPIKGYKTAWLLWPDSNVWSDGEIDFPEGDLSGSIYAFSHCAGNPSSNCLAVNTGVTYTSWHTAITEWTPGKVVFTLDGKVIGSTTNSVASKSMHYVLQTESCYKSQSACPTDLTHSSDVQLDWIAIYSYTP
jgi:hypothetical protein